MTQHHRHSPSFSGDLSRQVQGILGLGLDPRDGNARISRGPFFKLLQGSEESHAAMLELCLKLTEQLEQRGLVLQDLNEEELVALIRDVEGETSDS